VPVATLCVFVASLDPCTFKPDPAKTTFSEDQPGFCDLAFATLCKGPKLKTVKLKRLNELKFRTARKKMIKNTQKM
jgi:hypothetical protein